MISTHNESTMSTVENLPGALHELSLSAAASAVRKGDVSSSKYAAALLEQARAHKELNAFITLDEEAVLEAARTADLEREKGKPLGLLHGLPLAIKDSINTRDLPTSVGTKVLAGNRPKKDATAVATLRDAGAIVFGKSNLVEMSSGLTGFNAHYGQVKNPYDRSRITGGSSSGSAASVAARIVPAALGGDTVGSIRVPAALCGVVGFRPSMGRWPGDGAAPLSPTFDTLGPIARTVEDCALLDAVVTGGAWGGRSPVPGLKGLRFAYAPRQYLDMVDPEVEACFREALVALGKAGAEIIEIDLGEDFRTLAFQANWPVLAHETMPAVTAYLAEQRMAATFDEIYEGLGENLKSAWADSVVRGAPNAISDQIYDTSIRVQRRALQERFATAYRSHELTGLLFPATPTVAPPISAHSQFTVAGHLVNRITIARNAFPSSCAGLPGICIPIGLSAAGLPISMEIDGPHGSDVMLLAAVSRVAATLGPIAGPGAA